MSDESRGAEQQAPPLKSREELTEHDFVAVETDDTRLIIGYMVGQRGGFMYIMDELSIFSNDLTNFSATRLVPELIMFTGGVRAINTSHIRSFFHPSIPLRLLYAKTIHELLNGPVDEKPEDKSEDDFDFDDALEGNPTVH